MKIKMADLQRVLEVLREIEGYEPDETGRLGKIRADAFCARIAIETVIGFEDVEVA